MSIPVPFRVTADEPLIRSTVDGCITVRTPNRIRQTAPVYRKNRICNRWLRKFQAQLIACCGKWRYDFGKEVRECCLKKSIHSGPFVSPSFCQEF